MINKLFCVFVFCAIFIVLPATSHAAATFTGTVTYDDDGTPVGGAWVKFFSFDTGMGDQGITFAEGVYSFTVDDIDPGDMVYHGIEPSVFWESDWFALGYNQTWEVPESGTLEVDFVVTRTNASLAGTVLMPDGAEGRATGSIFLVNDEHTFWTMNFGNDDWDFGDYWSNCRAGTYRLYFFPDLGTNPDWQNYAFDSRLITIAEGENELDIQLVDKNATIKATVTVDGEPAHGVSVTAIRGDEYVEVGTNAQGVAELMVTPGHEFEVTPIDNPNFSYRGATGYVTTVANETQEISFASTSPDITLNASINDAQGELLDTASGSFWCEADDGQAYNTNIENGIGTIKALSNETTGVFDGTCHTWINDTDEGALQEEAVSVEGGGSEGIDFNLVSESSSVVISVKDQEGNVLTNTSGGVINLWSDEINTAYNQELGITGEETISVIPGNYNGSISFSNQDYELVLDESAYVFTATKDAVATLDLIVVKTDGVVTGTVKDEDGNNLTHGSVACDNWDATTQTSYETNSNIEDGAYELYLPAGDTYSCSVSLPEEFMDEGLLPPVAQEVAYNNSGDELEELNFALAIADSTLDIDLTIQDDVNNNNAIDDFDNITCFSYSTDGGYNKAGVENSDIGELKIDSDRDWYVECEGQDGDDWYETDPVLVNATSAGEITQDLVLEPSEYKDVHDPVSKNFDADQDRVITLDDKTTLSVPANALDTGGTVTVNAYPEREPMHTGDIPVSNSWNFEAYDADGAIITSFIEDVNITIPYNEELITDLGLSEHELLPKYFDDITNSWKATPNATVDIENNTITVSTDHFSTYGITYNANLVEEEAPTKPTKLKVKKRFARKALLKWTADADYCNVQVKTKTGKKVKTFKNVGKNKKWLKKKYTKSNAGYKFRVKACTSSDSCSVFSKYKNFRTKPAKVTRLKFNRGTGKLRWKKVNGKKITYQIKLLNRKHKKIKIITSSKKYKMIKKLPKKTSKIRVRAKYNNANIGAWSKAIKL